MATSPEHELQISELFYSIQGESTFAGYPCVFIRLTGCNLACSYCDSQYAVAEPGTAYSIDTIVEFANKYPGDLVEITGGEPLCQENVYPLMQRLLDTDRIVLLETNGSVSLEKVPAKVVKIMDIKCPGSGMHEKMAINNLEYLTPVDEVKFVISSSDDYIWSKNFITEHELHMKTKILFSPNTRKIKAADLAGKILEDRLPVRLQLQLHTLLWPDINRGV